MNAEKELQEVLDKAGPEMRDVARAIYDLGLEAGLERVRRELSAWIYANHWREDGVGAHVVPHERLLRALDRICPERKG